MAVIDDACPLSLMDAFQFLVMFLAVASLAIALIPFLAVIVFVVALVMIGLRAVFIRTARDAMRLESVHRSPLLAHVFNTLSGLPVIRSETEAKRNFSRAFDALQDRLTRATVTNDALTRWLSMYTDIIVLLLAAATAFAVVYFRSTLSPASTALVLIHALSLTDMMQWMMRKAVEVEVQLTSCERVLEYSSLPTEEVCVCEFV
jgi:ATP-binding cassette, subfamily C (CFTR/MRP), member 1